MKLNAICLCALIVCSPLAVTHAQVLDDPIQVHLNSKRFDEAIKAAENDVTNRDALFGRIALAQVSSGLTSDAKDSLRRINDAGALSKVTNELQASGGATGADFQTLIDLITTTVAPNSWDEVGGPGAIAEFPGGVFVDAKGVLRQSKKTRKHRTKQNEQRELKDARNAARTQLGSDDARRPSNLRMVSLTRLQRELQLSLSFGEAPTEAMRHLAGLNEIRYLFLFPETNDCVIAGPAGNWDAQNDPSQTHLLLDDLVTLLKNAEESKGQFGCSITPQQTNLANTKRFLSKPTGPLKPRETSRWVREIRKTLGLQNIEVAGIDPRSHVAHVLVEADYHMKLVGMGLEPSVRGVPSYLQSIAKDQIPQSMDVLRWWFTLHPDSVMRDDEGDSFRFREQVVRLQSENERIGDAGERFHTGKSSALNQQFADRFTSNYGRLAEKYVIYKHLDHVFRLALVAALLHSDEVTSKIDWDPSWFTSTLTTAMGQAPSKVPSIVNHRLVNRRHVVVGVSGGVKVDAFAVTKRLRHVSDAGAVATDRTTAVPTTQRSSERWWWD